MSTLTFSCGEIIEVLPAKLQGVDDKTEGCAF